MYRNKRLLALARHSPCCFRCRKSNDGTIVAAHANLASMGKGMGLKAADIPAFLCFECHSWVDSGPPPKSSRDAEWALAAVHTLKWVFENKPETFWEKR
jgi:hypothetical protein